MVSKETLKKSVNHTVFLGQFGINFANFKIGSLPIVRMITGASGISGVRVKTTSVIREVIPRTLSMYQMTVIYFRVN